MRSPPAGYLVHNLRCPVVVCRGRRQDREAKVEGGAGWGQVGRVQEGGRVGGWREGGGRVGVCCRLLGGTSLWLGPGDHRYVAGGGDDGSQRPGAPVAAPQAPRKVMVSLDDSEASRKALEVRPLDVPLPCSRSRCAGGTCAPYHHM
jgi:hypothetical protein